MVSQIHPHAEYLDRIIQHHHYSANDLLQMLREAQEHYGYIHSDAIDYLSKQLSLPRSKIEGVASFYSFLYLQPHGEYRILFSDNITDRMLGNIDLLKLMCSQLWVEPGKLSEDGLLSISTTSCTGMCDQGPAMLVNNIAVNRMNAERVNAICELIRERVPVSAWPVGFFVIEDNIRRKDILLGSDFRSGTALTALFQRGADEILNEVKISKLRGRGGAGSRHHAALATGRSRSSLPFLQVSSNRLQTRFVSSSNCFKQYLSLRPSTFQSRYRRSSPGVYSRCSANSMEKPWKGLRCTPAT